MIFTKNLYEIKDIIDNQSFEILEFFKIMKDSLPKAVISKYKNKRRKIEAVILDLSSYIERFIYTLEEFTKSKANIENQSSIYEFNEEEIESELTTLRRENMLLRSQLNESDEKIIEMNKNCDSLLIEINNYMTTTNILRKIIKEIKLHQNQLDKETPAIKVDKFDHKRSFDLKIAGVINEKQSETEEIQERCDVPQNRRDGLPSITQFKINILDDSIPKSESSIDLNVSRLEKIHYQKEYDKLKLELESAYQTINSRERVAQEFQNLNIANTEKIESLKIEIESLRCSMKKSKTSSLFLEDFKGIKLEFEEFKLSVEKNLKLFEQDFKSLAANIAEEVLINLKTYTKEILELQESNESLNMHSEALKDSFRGEIKMMNLEIQDLKIKNHQISSSLTQAVESLAGHEKYFKDFFEMLPLSIEKTPLSLKSYFATMHSIICELSEELEERNPQNFLERIGEIKDNRDSSYLEAQRLSDILNELEECTGTSSSLLLSYIQNIQQICSNLG